MTGATPQITRALIVEEALSWSGTPFHHQSSVKGVGCDCVGLVRGVWRRLYGFEPAGMPNYSTDWAEASGHETLCEAGRQHLRQIDQQDTLSGDVLVFRMRSHGPAKHAAILVDSGRIIHAHEGAAVQVVHLGSHWQQRIAYAFQFPGITG